jgi:hypothetical protein
VFAYVLNWVSLCALASRCSNVPRLTHQHTHACSLLGWKMGIRKKTVRRLYIHVTGAAYDSCLIVPYYAQPRCPGSKHCMESDQANYPYLIIYVQCLTGTFERTCSLNVEPRARPQDTHASVHAVVLLSCHAVWMCSTHASTSVFLCMYNEQSTLVRPRICRGVMHRCAVLCVRWAALCCAKHCIFDVRFGVLGFIDDLNLEHFLIASPCAARQ